MTRQESKIIDLGEATTLLTLGFNLDRLESSNTGKHKIFVFIWQHPTSPDVNVDNVLDVYTRRQLSVDAHTFYRSGKELKNRIHAHTELSERTG